jgi:hypothetical protein
MVNINSKVIISDTYFNQSHQFLFLKSEGSKYFSSVLHLLFMVLFSLAITCSMQAQEKVKGSVVDEQEAPLSYATITLHSLENDSILAFGFTNNKGVFEIGLPTFTQFEVRANSLGKKPDTIRISGPFDSPLRFILSPASNELPGVTIRTARKPIVEKGDTTTYGVSKFKEAEDDRVEEILRKIPGIEVKEDGSINVKGKPLHRILVEGSDLFGKDYQLASKNIRAKDIATIEEIDHYQENIILRSVNKSEAIVLNLKLKEEAKSVISGSIIPGIGYGDEFKYNEYASIFNVSRKNKTIFIGSLDNVASGFGGQSLEANYNGSQAYDLRNNVNDHWRLRDNNKFNNLGLRPEYTDNGKSLYTTLRNETNLSPQWTLNVNGVYGKTSKAQRQLNEQSFLADATLFQFQEINDWSNQLRFFAPEVELSYIDKQQKTSIDLFAKTSREGFTQLESRLLNQVAASENREDQLRNTNARALLSRQFRSGFVGLLEISTGALQENLGAAVTNSPLPAQLNLEDEENTNTFNQSLELVKKTSALRPTFLYRIGQSILELKIELIHRQLKGTHHTRPEARNTFFVGTSQEVNISSLSSAVALKFPFGKKATMSTSFTAGSDNYSYLTSGNVYPYSIKSTYELKRSDGITLRVSGLQEKAPPSDLQHLYDLPFVASVRTLTLSGDAPVLSGNTRLSAFLNKKSQLQLSSLQFRASVSRKANVNFNTTNFNGSSLISSLTNGRNQRSTSGRVRYDKFIAAVKSNLILAYNTSYSLTDYLIQGRDVEIKSWRNSLSVAVNSLITRSFRIKGGSRLDLTTFPAEGENAQILSNLKTELEVILSSGPSKYFVGASNVQTSISDQSNSLYATFFGVKREMKTEHRTIVFNLRLYNLTNQGEFARFDSDAIFEFRSVTPTIGRFLLLKVDYGL